MSTRLSLHTEPSVPNIGSGGNVAIHHRRPSHVNSDMLKIPSAIVVSGLEHASLPAQRAVLRTLAEKKLVVSDNHSEIESELQLDLPDDFIMVYVCRLDPHERPPIYNSLVCTFYTVSCVILYVPARLVCYEYTARQHHPQPYPRPQYQGIHSLTWLCQARRPLLHQTTPRP